MTTADSLFEDPFSGFSGEDKLKAHPKKFQKRRVLPSADMSSKRQNHKPKWQLQAVPHAICSDVVTYLMAAKKAKKRDLAIRKMLYYRNKTFKARKDQFYNGTNKVMKVIAEESQKKVHEEFYNTKIELLKTVFEEIMREGFQGELEMDDQILALRRALQTMVTNRPKLPTKSKNLVRSSSKRGRRREDSASSSTSTKRSSSTSTTRSSTRSSQDGRRGGSPKSYGGRKTRGKKQAKSPKSKKLRFRTPTPKKRGQRSKR